MKKNEFGIGEREIKFRAWDSIKKEMFLDLDMKSDYSRILGFGSQGYILMQYTWLEDGNGTEIYEGDIVRWKDENFVVKIDYYEDRGGVYDKNHFGFVGESENFFQTLPDICEGEVIGNIFTNPELLK